MNSIFSTPDWDMALAYKKHSFVTYSDGLIYYALIDIAAGSEWNSNNWGGTTFEGGKYAPQFIWKPSYNNNVIYSPRVLSIQFGDGYEQRVADGLNNNLITLDYNFDLRTSMEATAILHFLYNRKSTESFYFTPPAPYEEKLLFICKEWTHVESFYNNHSVRARFDQRIN